MDKQSLLPTCGGVCVHVLGGGTADRLAQLVDYRAGGHGFKPWPDQHSGSLNNRGESAAFVMTSTNG